MDPGPGDEPWPHSVEQLEVAQQRLGDREPSVPPWTLPSTRPLRVGGVFVVFGRGPAGREPAWAAAVVMEEGRVIGTAVTSGEATAQYDPGHLALQRGPLLQAAVQQLRPPPDVVLVNATGRDHPRRAGLALHLGAVLVIPTVGATDHPLAAIAPDLGPERGTAVPLELGGEVVGFVVRTRRRARPVMAHAAWRTDAETARRVVTLVTGRARTPEPLRLARFLARLERARDEGRLLAAPPAIETILRPMSHRT
jgi:deoxyribonuclease V